jgi:hypothetical protein
MKFISLVSAAVLVFATAAFAAPHNILSAKDMLLGKRVEHWKYHFIPEKGASEVIECVLMSSGEIGFSSVAEGDAKRAEHGF